MSLSDAASLRQPSAELARFTLWPMPKLELVAHTAGPHLHTVNVSSAEDVAYENGVRDGRSTARSEFAEEIQRAVHALGGAAEQLHTERSSNAKIMEEHVFKLSIAVARVVIQREVAENSAVIGEMVRRALGEVSWEASIEVKLHPDDITSVEAHFAGLDGEAKPSRLEWIPEESIERGGYIIDTPRRLVDGTLDTVLDSLYEQLAND